MKLIKGQYYWIKYEYRNKGSWFPAQYSGDKNEPTSWNIIGDDWGLSFDSVKVGSRIKVPEDV